METISSVQTFNVQNLCVPSFVRAWKLCRICSLFMFLRDSYWWRSWQVGNSSSGSRILQNPMFAAGHPVLIVHRSWLLGSFCLVLYISVSVPQWFCTSCCSELRVLSRAFLFEVVYQVRSVKLSFVFPAVCTYYKRLFHCIHCPVENMFKLQTFLFSRADTFALH